MPIFMDRHDMPYATAKDVADAHNVDLQIQDRHGVKYMAYWFDERRHSTFCLIDAPDAAAAERVHREGHGEIANAIIPVELSVVEAFLGRIGDPLAAAETAAPAIDAGLRAVMFTDIVGSTEMTARLGDAAALELVRAHDAIVRRGLAMHGGREVKHTGDGMMASFEDVTSAVHAAAAIQRGFAVFNADASERLSVRIGVDAGEPVQDDRDLFGATVNLASRLCSEADAGGVLVSGFVRELCSEAPLRFISLGERRLKGFSKGILVFRLEWNDDFDADERSAGSLSDLRVHTFAE